MSLSFTQKMKLAKDLIMNASKITQLIKDKSDELFNYQQKTMFPNGRGHIKINGKGECLEIKFAPDLKNDQPELERQIAAAITKSNADMLQFYIEQGKKISQDIDPDLLKQIENEIEENKT